VKPCQYLYLATQMTKGIVKITNILLQCAVHLHGVDKSLLLLIEKSLESLVVTQWADMAASDGMLIHSRQKWWPQQLVRVGSFKN